MTPASTKAGLQDWLTWLEHLHPQEIDLGLERVSAVAARLGVATPSVPVVTVAGTNGKGSVCHLIAAILGAGGRRVGLYTSPHLSRFNERVRIAGEEADDEALCTAFERVEGARGDVSLTFFEFTTLAALDLFATAAVDVIVLEVGLGGRLDATNVVDPDVAVVTSVALDHAEWLGTDRDAIAREKAGIARAGRPLILGESEPAAGLLAAAADCGAAVRRAGVDFDHEPTASGWRWRRCDGVAVGLPVPATGGGYQLRNAATALAALDALGVEAGDPAVAQGLGQARVPGRFEVLAVAGADGGSVEVVLDVAHNPAAAQALADALAGATPTSAVLAMYADKDIEGVIAALAPVVERWYPATLPEARGADGARLVVAIEAGGGRSPAAAAEGPVAAFETARAEARSGERILVVGSFATVGPVRAWLERSAT